MCQCIKTQIAMQFQIQFQLLCLLICGLSIETDAKSAIIDATFGLITGTIEESHPNRRPYRSFTSVPYADPPVGKLRLKPPQPLPGWGNPGLYVVDASKPSPVCPQFDFR